MVKSLIVGRSRWKTYVVASGFILGCIGKSEVDRTMHAEEKIVPVKISGGHDTDRRDGGRPVVLIAAALKVKPEIFREAFAGVTPAKNGRPTKEQAHVNKSALMNVLGPHGVTNERLDEVSDYYRYRPQNGKLWKNRDAKVQAIVDEGKVIRIEIKDPGAGYSSVPKIVVPGFEKQNLTVRLRFEVDLKKNGAIESITVPAE